MKRGIPPIILGLLFLILSDCSDMLNDLLHPGGSGRIYSSETSCTLDGKYVWVANESSTTVVKLLY